MKRMILLIVIVLVLMVPIQAYAFLTKANFASSTLVNEVIPASPSLTVQPGDGTKFPASGTFNVIVSNCNAFTPLLACTIREIMTLTKAGSDVFTIVGHAQETTTSPSVWAAGSLVRMEPTAYWFTEIQTTITNNATQAGIISSLTYTPMPQPDLVSSSSPTTTTRFICVGVDGNIFASITSCQ